jgi:hypothetical protein
MSLRALSLASNGPALGAQAGEARLGEVVMKDGFTRFRRDRAYGSIWCGTPGREPYGSPACGCPGTFCLRFGAPPGIVRVGIHWQGRD